MSGGLKIFKTIGVVLTLEISMSACAGLLTHGMGWKEEVQLQDGRVIVVERFFNLGGYPTIDSRERTLLDQTITFTSPDSNKTISWKTEFRNEIPEPNGLSPLLLDVVKGVPYLATSPAGCIAYNKWGRPNPPYIFLKYINAAWQRIPLDEFPSELVQTNLMPTPASSLLKPYYTQEEANAERRSGNISAYAKTIMREAVATESRACPKMIPYGKGGWLGLDWFSDQPTFEACSKFCEAKSVNPHHCPCEQLFRRKWE